MSYSLKVDVHHREAAAAESPSTAGLLSRVASSSSAAELAGDSISFSAGNPRVEHITGVVHLYRDISPADAAAQPAWTPQVQRGEQLAVLAVQPEMGVSDFCTFLGGYLASVSEIRFVRRDDSRTSCLVLLRFNAASIAASFYKDHNNKPFWSLEPDVLCRLVFVKDVQFASSSAEQTAVPSPSQTELPTCPVCLERLDRHISGVVTTVCNHKFHNECLKQWADTSCPVCRYCLSGEATTSHCSICSTSVDLWICLICGHVGCGRYRSGHASSHWQETNHCYALELETQRVWDYVSDGYVHRLVQSKTDGKLVEVPSPLPPGQDDRAGAANAEARYDADMEEAIVSSKLEGVAAEYDSLLAHQLESQRQWYEAKQARAVAEVEARCAVLAAASAESKAAAKASEQALLKAVSLQQATSDKLANATQKLKEVQRQRIEVVVMNDSMIRDAEKWKQQLETAKATMAAVVKEKDGKIQDLEEQVRDLMMYFEGQRLVGEAAPEMGLDQGSLSLPATPPSASSDRTPSRRVARRTRS